MGRRDWGSGSVERRGKGRWRLSFEVGRDPDTGTRRRRRWAFKGTKREAIQALLTAMSEYENGGVNPDEITTEEWLAQWLEERVRDGAIGPEVAYNYENILKRHLNPEFGDVRLQDLRVNHVRNLKTKLSKSLKPGTTKKILSVLKQALTAAVEAELLDGNPALSVRSPSPDREANESRALEKKEIKKLVKAAKGTPYAMVIRFALATGVRQAELLGATWNAIDLERGTFQVMQTLKIVDGKFELVRPKTPRSRRTIELSAVTVKSLRKHHKKQNAARLALGEAWEDHDLVFPDRGGRYWHRVVFYRGYRQLVNGSGIARPREVKFHTLRHTAASQWLKARVDPLIVQRRLGHASAAFTLDVYGHELTGQQSPAAEALDDLIA